MFLLLRVYHLLTRSSYLRIDRLFLTQLLIVMANSFSEQIVLVSTILLPALDKQGGKYWPSSPVIIAHDVSAKKGKGNALPGIFTQAYACQYVLSALEEAIERGDIKEEVVTEDLLRGFLGEWGRRFYGVDNSTRKILLTKGNETIVEAFKGPDVEIVPFKKGEITWSLRWQWLDDFSDGFHLRIYGEEAR